MLKCYMIIVSLTFKSIFFDQERWGQEIIIFLVTGQNWGQVHNFRFNCCFICVDAATPVLDHYVEQRVDCMIDSGLLNEVYDIYNLNADYTKGLRQAIGVREFENFLEFYLSNSSSNKPVDSNDDSMFQIPKDNGDKVLKEKMRAILNSPRDNKQKILLEEAINKVKLNTRRLVHRQVSACLCFPITGLGTCYLCFLACPFRKKEVFNFLY